MRDASQAQGWYRDPYGLREDQYFSQGLPTKLVRDDERESFDFPPGEALPGVDLVAAGQSGVQAADGSDLLRADEADYRYDHGKALTEAFGMVTQPRCSGVRPRPRPEDFDKWLSPVRADDGNRTRMTSLEGNGPGAADLRLRRWTVLFRCP